MIFLRIPASVILVKDDGEEIMDGLAIINIEEIQDIVSNDNEKCTICFKSGDSLGCLLSIDNMAAILPECK